MSASSCKEMTKKREAEIRRRREQERGLKTVMHPWWHDEIDDLLAEIDRLRAALKECQERATYLTGIVPTRSQAENYSKLILATTMTALEQK